MARKRALLELAVYAVLSGLGSFVTYVSMFGDASYAERCIAVAYGPTWLVVNSFFGGIHGAPKWSTLPSVVIAVFFQNALIWWSLRATGKWLRSRGQYG